MLSDIQKPTCHNHKAGKTLPLSSARDITGIGSTACARHGCFCPHSTVDLQKGERCSALLIELSKAPGLSDLRQSNMDYSFCQAIKHTGGDEIERAIKIYDIECQHSVHFKERVSKSPGLHLPPALHIVSAIGLFHLHGHVATCFPRYSLSFIVGAGLIAGEIMETLWPSLNKLSSGTRTMTVAHRQEVLDDHMADSNFKKMVGIGMFGTISEHSCY